MDDIGPEMGAFLLNGRFRPRFASCRGFEDTTMEDWRSEADLQVRFKTRPPPAPTEPRALAAIQILWFNRDRG
jgi:hypothetical protein